MFTRKIEVDIDALTFPAAKLPLFLQGAGGPESVGIASALLMLGTITVPGGFSLASPARYWAWVRYFSAVSRDPDLRISQPFVELDPHQRGILSDDFGVAVCTKYLFDRMGGFAEIVDGRRFALQYASLISRPVKKKPPKVGGGKCPDFVIRDHFGKWHVLECKGTQASEYYRNVQLNKAVSQKKVIDIKGSLKGAQLAAGIFLASDGKFRSNLRIVDPEVREPLVEVTKRNVGSADIAVRRIATSRALGLAGLGRLAEEMSLPPELDEELVEYYSPGELRRMQRPAADRMREALGAIDSVRPTRFTHLGESYFGRSASLDLPGEDFQASTGFDRIEISVGINEDFSERIRSGVTEPFGRIDEQAKSFLGNDGVRFRGDETEITVTDGRLFFGKMQFR